MIDEPWISHLLEGRKHWEMRSSHTSHRGTIALIRKGSGLVVGTAELVDSIGPLREEAWHEARHLHRIPVEQYAATQRWNHAWVLQNVASLPSPIPYQHPNGAVVWVRLPDDVVQGIDRPRVSGRHCQAAEVGKIDEMSDRAVCFELGSRDEFFVPVAKDGTWFSPGLFRGGYRIGPKGEERVVADYIDAVRNLNEMTSPCWRRPNAKGNWGIVTGVAWMSSRDLKNELAAEERNT